MNRDAGTDQFVVIATRGGTDQAGVAPLGHQHPHHHAAQGGGDQGGGQRLAGDEVRRGQQDLPLSAGDGGEIQLGDGVAIVVGAGFDDLQPWAGRFGEMGKKFRFERFLAGGEVPIFQEDELQAMNRFTLDAQVQVAPSLRSLLEMAVSVADVDAASEADPTITDHDLAVSAEVDVAQTQAAQADGIEPGYLDPGVPQRL